MKRTLYDKIRFLSMKVRNAQILSRPISGERQLRLRLHRRGLWFDRLVLTSRPR